MSTKLKVLGLGLLALLATSAFTVSNVSAKISGHFTSPVHHVILKGTEQFDPNDPTKTHNLTFQRTVNGAASGDPIKCTHVAYHGTLSGAEATTTQTVALRPDYTGLENCSTKGTGPHNVEVDVPTSCKTNVFLFHSGNPGTVTLKCPITVTHPNCTIVMPEQSLNGITYNTITEGGKHAITAGVDVGNITGHFESGICVFLGTSHIFHMKGAVTVWGEDSAGNRVDVTHTTP